MSKAEARKLRIIGIVQGVGFRPFVYRLATSYDLKGYVINLGGSEVEVWVEGPVESIENFIRDLNLRKPPTAIIENLEVEKARPRGYKEFKILKSEKKATVYSAIPPDFGICEHCMKEVLDSGSRWYLYPFNSCAWCGPRFSMMYTILYDRENTAMRDFPLCKDCLKEYSDPSNIRRFHAQGISCPKCGPKVFLTTKDGEEIDGDPIVTAAKLIDEGYIVAIKGVGGFHIASLASDDSVVAVLRKRKRRPQKPFALMTLDENTVFLIANPSLKHLELLRRLERPIVLLPKKEDSPVSELVAPGLNYLGIMLPYTSLHYLLLEQTKDRFLIMTSGNPPGLPIVKDNDKALAKLKHIADYFLLHNREIVNRVDDSVIRLSAGEVMMLRRSRGYVPYWFRLPFKLKRKVVAFGAMLANTGAVAFDEYVIPTQYVGDCENLENLDFLLSSLEFLEDAYKLNPEVIVSDKHPNYLTTTLAGRISRENNKPHLKVQHHHAHIVSAMASNKLPQNAEVTGIAIDGVGYGDDGSIWGGEILHVTYYDYSREGHLEYLPLPGGDRATVWPARIIVGFLAEKLGVEEAIAEAKKLNISKMLPYGEREIAVSAKITGESPRASSVGRFLDAVSALLGVCWHRTYEGEPAMKLEAAAYGGALIDELKLEYEERDNVAVILTGEFIEKIIEIKDKQSLRDLAYTTQYSLGKALAEIAIEKHRSLPIVVSGGAAVNDYILKGIKDVIAGKTALILPKSIPAGDGGISLGQAVIAGIVEK